MKSLARSIIDSMLPKGPAWFIKVNGFLDKTLNSIAIILGKTIETLNVSQYITDPEKTTELASLEREFGVVPGTEATVVPETDATIAQRRIDLKSKINNTKNLATAGFLQNKLQNAGFNDLLVYDNSPIIDPTIVFQSDNILYAGGENAYAGNNKAFASTFMGVDERLIVANTKSYINESGSTAVAGNNSMYADNRSTSKAIAGFFTSTLRTQRFFEIPNDVKSHGFIFFVGGVATRDVKGDITSIQKVQVSRIKEDQLNEIILAYKPLHAWCILLVDYA